MSTHSYRRQLETYLVILPRSVASLPDADSLDGEVLLAHLPATIGRARLQQSPAALQIVIPAYWDRHDFWFAVVIRPVLALFGVAMAWRVFANSPVFMGLLTIAVVAGVTINWAWKGLGREIIVVNEEVLTLRWEVLVVGWNHRYLVNQMSNLRFSKQKVYPHRKYVMFDYGARVPWTELVVSILLLFFGRGRSYDPHTPRFGRGLSESEGGELVRALETFAGAHLLA